MPGVYVSGGTVTGLWADAGWPPPLSSFDPYVGYLFYLAPGDNRRPDPTAETLQQHLAAGRDLAPIWQAAKVDIAAGGFDLGVQHAKAANADAEAKAVPKWCPIIYACDSDRLPEPQYATRDAYVPYQGTREYFRGVLSAPGRPVAAYGGSYLLDALNVDLGIRWGMQTVNAWSRVGDKGTGDLHYAEIACFAQGAQVSVPGGVVDEDTPLQPYPTWRTGPMARMLTYDEILAAFRWAGVPFREYSGSRDRCRCHTGPHSAGGTMVRPFTPAGTLVHITAGNLGSRSVDQYIADIINGDSAVPFKAQFVVAPDGQAVINGVGRANHCGSMSTAARDALVNETFSLDDYQDLRGSDLTGNTFAYGIENINAGPPNAAQRDTSVRICAAVSHAYGWNGRDCAGHGEVANDRSYSDPGMNMGLFRRDVMAFVAGGPPPPPPPTDTGDDFMSGDMSQATRDFFQSMFDRLGSQISAVNHSDGISGAGDASNQALQLAKDGLALPVRIVADDTQAKPAGAATGAATLPEPAFPSFLSQQRDTDAGAGADQHGDA